VLLKVAKQLAALLKVAKQLAVQPLSAKLPLNKRLAQA